MSIIIISHIAKLYCSVIIGNTLARYSYDKYNDDPKDDQG